MRRRKRYDVRDWPVMAKQCATCVLRCDEHGRYVDPHLANSVIERCLTQASQICHHSALHGKKQTHLCRGVRDFQIMIFHRMGFLSAPTDEAWQNRRDELGI
jgi:hypothetical protein